MNLKSSWTQKILDLVRRLSSSQDGVYFKITIALYIIFVKHVSRPVESRVRCMQFLCKASSSFRTVSNIINRCSLSFHLSISVWSKDRHFHFTRTEVGIFLFCFLSSIYHPNFTKLHNSSSGRSFNLFPLNSDIPMKSNSGCLIKTISQTHHVHKSQSLGPILIRLTHAHTYSRLQSNIIFSSTSRFLVCTSLAHSHKQYSIFEMSSVSFNVKKNS